MESKSILSTISPSVIETVTKCVKAASDGQSSITFFKIAATSLRKNNVYYRFYFVGANTLFSYIIPFVFQVVINIMTVIVLNKKTSDIRISTYIPKQVSRVSQRKRSRYTSTEEVNSNHVSATFEFCKPKKQINLTPSVLVLDSRDIHCVDNSVDEIQIESDNRSLDQRDDENSIHCFVNAFQSNENERNDFELSKQENPKVDTIVQVDSTAAAITIVPTQLSLFDTIDHIQSPLFDKISPIQTTPLNTTGHHLKSPSILVTLIDIEESENVTSTKLSTNEGLSQISTPVSGQPLPEGLVRHGGSVSGLPFAQEVRLTRISISIICLYLVINFFQSVVFG